MTLLAAAAASTTAPPPVLIPTPSRALIFEDDFDGPLDTTIWEPYTRLVPIGAQEAAYLPDPAYVYTEASNLVLKAVREPYGAAPWRSGRVQTGARRHFWYGRYEARMKLPTGKGTWPAWWTMGGSLTGRAGFDWDEHPGVPWPHPGEIDIMEHLNANPSIIVNTHWTNASSNLANSSSGLDVTQWHTYACEWTPEQITFYVDDVQVAAWDVNNATTSAAIPHIGVNNAFRRPHQLILNLALGGWPGSTDASTPSPSTVLVDWVRVWSLDDERYVDVPVTGISLSATSLALPVGDSGSKFLLDTLTTPEGKVPHDPTVYWTSSDESVATAGGGRVIGRSPGTCTVTATTRDGGYTATCAVTVTG